MLIISKVWHLVLVTVKKKKIEFAVSCIHLLMHSVTLEGVNCNHSIYVFGYILFFPVALPWLTLNTLKLVS